MNIFMEMALFSLIILIYWIITELFTILFHITGLPEEKARFQVISLLTGTGYTTRESELFLSTRKRRQLARITMLFGYVFRMTIVSAFINVFLSLKLSRTEHIYFGILIPIASFIIIFVFLRFPRFRAWLYGVLLKIADRIVGREDDANTVMLLDYIGADSIARVMLNSIPEEFRDVPLSETGLKSKTGILVMLIEKPGKTAVSAGADTVFTEGDKITVFGNYSMICKVFHAHERFADD